MSERIKITDLMAVALTMAVPMGDELRVPMQFQGSSGTMTGLVSRGLTESRFLANADLPGYEGKYPDVKNWYTVLTPRGEAMRRRLAVDPSLKSVRTEELDQAPEPVKDEAPEAEPVKAESTGDGDVMFTVTIQYWSGAEEILPGIDEENARAYLAEAMRSVRVRAAEMRAEDGSQATGFRRPERPREAVPLG